VFVVSTRHAFALAYVSFFQRLSPLSKTHLRQHLLKIKRSASPGSYPMSRDYTHMMLGGHVG
jgi:hypothetical protein